MDRERLEELMTGLLDDELTSDERAELDRELETSEEARNLLESYREQSRLLVGLGGLTVPAKLKDKAKERLASEPVPLRPSAKNNVVWLIGTIAACLAFFWMGSVVQTPSTDGKLYLASDRLYESSTGEVHQVFLRSSEQVRVLHSETLSGVLTQGQARCAFEADAGQVEGQSLRLRLSLDLDGDEEYDLVQESEIFTMDSRDGYEVVTAEFPPLATEHEGQKLQGKARLELVGQSLTGDGLALQFHPERAHLSLPIEQGRVI